MAKCPAGHCVVHGRHCLSRISFPSVQGVDRYCPDGHAALHCLHLPAEESVYDAPVQNESEAMYSPALHSKHSAHASS
jgi:hypothetical protein